MRGPGGPSRSGDDDVPLEEVVFSCSVCQKLISEVYAQVESNRGFHSSTCNKNAMVTKLWIGSCSHVLCSEHLEGGGAPFHPKGQYPQAPCPTCIQTLQDSSPKDLFAIHGLEPHAHDATIPASWFNCPPIKLDDSLPGMEALRYASLIRYSRGITKKWQAEKHQNQAIKDAYLVERSIRQARDTELQKLKLETKDFDQTKQKLTKWEARKASINHNLNLIPEMTHEIASLNTQLAALGYRVPQRKYALESHASNGPTGKLPTAIETDSQEHSSSSARKRKYAEAVSEINDEAHDMQVSTKVGSREMMPPPSLARSERSDRGQLDAPNVTESSQYTPRPGNKIDYCSHENHRTYQSTGHPASRLPSRALPLRPASNTISSQPNLFHDLGYSPQHRAPFESSAEMPGPHGAQLAVCRPQPRALHDPDVYSTAARPMLYAKQLSEFAAPQDVHGVYEMQKRCDEPQITYQRHTSRHQDERFRPVSRAFPRKANPSSQSSIPAVSSVSSPFFNRGNSSIGWSAPASEHVQDYIYGKPYNRNLPLPSQKSYLRFGTSPKRSQNSSPSRNVFTRTYNSVIPVTPRQSYQPAGRFEALESFSQNKKQNHFQRDRITLVPSQSASSLRIGGDENSLSHIRGIKGVGAKSSYSGNQQHSNAPVSNTSRALFSSAGARRVVRR
ncbi:Hypothetical protein R9X50_00506600 [Acrodontium crateriforme]|uniref:Uncharacterized protein n=1 Tax=Acrodontium crateriforme TaxID=150365 RepID=A0AAQ3R5M1_9PEZI|nr:Hypothetical protein R9X50_00506600 [Acrodontium crateriforme]